MIRLVLCLLAAGFGLVTTESSSAGAPASAEAFQPAQLRDFPRTQLTIQRRTGRDTFQIWLAQTPAEQEQGLMWIRQLPADYGMLFPLESPRPMVMWMKNTYVALDMLFLDERGQVIQIVPRTTPLSETYISSKGVVSAVLEILAGEAQRRGIQVGDRVTYSAPVGNH